ncbi:MAG: S41 family peptidase [Planctomycetota bacterium]|jgi:carboxyl-terminal processing protease
MRGLHQTYTGGLVNLLVVWTVLAGGAVGLAQPDTKAEGIVQPPPNDVLARAIVSTIEKGKWDQAHAMLKNPPDDQRLGELKEIVAQYQAADKRRSEKQQKVYDKQYDKLTKLFDLYEVSDPNTSEVDVFSQAYDAWIEGTDAQQQSLKKHTTFQKALDAAYRKGTETYQGGDFTKAADHIRWVIWFEENNDAYNALDKKLERVNTITEFLKKDPCDETIERYARVKTETVAKVFAVLKANYVKAPGSRLMATAMVDQAAVLGDVLKSGPKGLLYTADPNACDAWTADIAKLSEDLKKTSAEPFDMLGLFAIQDMILVTNKQTLELPEGVILALTAESALAVLDSYTKVIWPDGVREFNKQITGQFGGVGFRISKDGDAIRVTSLIPGTPAAKSSLKPDARITAVDGELTKDMSITCAVRKISGLIGTSVTLTVTYPDSDKMELVTLTRAKIVLPTVEGSKQASNGKTEGKWDYFLSADEKIGYLHLSNFTKDTVSQVKGTLKKLEDAGLAGLILDLRGNGGGLLTAATELADMFIDKGVLLRSKGRSDRVSQWAATPDTVKRTYPVVILINGGSASASEIVAGVLGHQGYKRAVLVGDRSYGKGSVQEVIDLGPDAGKMKFTSAYYYLPNGKTVPNRDLLSREGRDDWGIVPDVSVPLYAFESKQMRKVNQARRDSEAEKKDEDKPSVTEQMIEADPQLATGLLVLKARMAVGG